MKTTTKPNGRCLRWHERKSQEITAAIKIDFAGTINICTAFHGSPFKECGAISARTKVVA